VAKAPTATPVGTPRAASEVSPVTMKPSPKKETARIQIPAQAKELPKATVKLQQAAPSNNPTVAIKPVVSNVAASQSDDTLSTPLSAAAFVCALIAFLVQLWIKLSS
jgi:hypothetical protein